MRGRHAENAADVLAERLDVDGRLGIVVEIEEPDHEASHSPASIARSAPRAVSASGPRERIQLHVNPLGLERAIDLVRCASNIVV